MNKKNIIKVLAIVLLIVVAVFISRAFTMDELKAVLLYFGEYSPIVYIVLFAILPIFFFPVPVLALVGGYLFGVLSGSIYTIIGAMINCILMFFMSRYLYGDMIRGYIDRKIDNKTKDKLLMEDSNEVFYMVIILRLIPLVPYNLINYASGLSSISLGRFLLASIIGIVPGTVIFINVGDKTNELNSVGFFISIALLVVLIVTSAVLGKKYGKMED